MIDALFAIGHAVMTPLYWAVSWILVQFHSLYAAIGLNAAGGVTWTLMIVGLVVVIRILLIPLFFKQIKASRDLQLLQPEIKKLQERYKNDKERQSQELMKLYRERKTNPLASCFPILAQGPVFFALFGVLNGIATNVPRGVLTSELVREGQNASIFGAKIFDTFLAPDNGAARVVALVLIVLMSATTFLTQKQLMTKNMPASAMTGPFAQQQKILLYVFPLMFAVTGVNFPIGVLLYWFTTNLWSMGQQLYVIRRQPAPGSLAAENLERKRAEKARQRGEQGSGVGASPAAPAAQAAPAPRGGSMTSMLAAGFRRSALGGLLEKGLSRRARTSSGGDAVVATSRSSGATALGAAAAPSESPAPGAPRGSAGASPRPPGRKGGGGTGGGGRAVARQSGAAGASPASPASRSSSQRQQPRRQSRAKRR